jgi:hypothetical protein
MNTCTKPTYWVTNRSNRNVTLADLALNIKAWTTVNLLDEKHYHYTIEQLEHSRLSGSIFKKQAMISVRDVPPPMPEKNSIAIVRDAIFPSKERSVFVIHQTEYDELKFDDDTEKETQKKLDEEYAKENADLTDVDYKRGT